ncbi:hypothetical protein WDU94_006329 [Cyamophila willieti]
MVCMLLLIASIRGDNKGSPGKAKCRLKRSTGKCRASITRFYFNTKTLRCESFIYGGCRGNANNFTSRKECERACAKYFNRRRPQEQEVEREDDDDDDRDIWEEVMATL